MKKLFSLLLIFSLLFSNAYAAVDWASMTADEIFAEIDNAKAELLKRELIGNTDNYTVFDEADVTIVFKGYTITTDYWLYETTLVIDFTIVNQSENDYEIFIDNAAINGWEVDNMGYCSAAAGHKAKGQLWFDLEDAEITTQDELETLEISFRYELPDQRKYAHTESVTLFFNN